MTNNLVDFVNIANSTNLSFRDITVSKSADGQAKLGNFLVSEGKKANDAAMKAFREALSKEYGVFGEHAFDTVLGHRHEMHQSLRACDVKNTLSKLESIKNTRFMFEINRQLDSNPRFLELSIDMDQMVRAELIANPRNGIDLSTCNDQKTLSALVDKRINDALEMAKQQARAKKELNIPVDMENVGWKPVVEGTEIEGDREPVGLKNLSNQFASRETSIADRMHKGSLGVGMRINRSVENPVLLDKLKGNGVEPGFIYKKDWSVKDSASMLMDYESEHSLQHLQDLKAHHPQIAAQCEGKSVRDQIMLFGHAHPAVMSAVADYVLEKGMSDQNSDIYKACLEKWPDPQSWGAIPKDQLKRDLFVQIRDAAMSVKPEDPDYQKSPVFKHFSDRHIVKLDYNESDKLDTGAAFSKTKFMRPERILTTRGKITGPIYRLQSADKPDNISAGAVTEALANDLSRLAGVTTQKLSIVRGQWSNGHPKIMLEAEFAKGYADLEDGFLKDGQVVSKGEGTTEKLGKYKAFFLVTADRDGVGKRGQNKGFAEGKFFAIDPGHSLEGNGSYLVVDDKFAFSDNYGRSTMPRFNNFSVFDDDTRFAKFQGALELRELNNSGRAQQLFDDYRRSFDPNELGISKEEKALRVKIQSEIAAKEKEYNDSMAKILNVAGNQFALYDDLAGQGPQIQEKAIETIENLEKLTSPTTWVSPKGEVALDHLQVKQETRVPWRAHVDGNNIVYHCDQPLSADAQARLRALAASAGPGANLTIDADGCAKLTFAIESADKSLSVFSETNVAKITHPEEFAARQMGEDPLAAARQAQAQQTQAAAQAQAPAQAPGNLVLPDRLTVSVGGKQIELRRQHYETMVNQTPANERPRSIDELKQILEARIAHGQEIATAVLAGKGSRYEASTRNVACLTLAMHAGTVAKGEYNFRGAFSVEDPDGRLYQWLDNCKDIYMRTSTHARHYHHQQIDGHMNMPRGIDIPEGMGGLMSGMRTLHYFAIPGNEQAGRRLFLKTETYGVYYTTIRKNDAEQSRSLGMQTRQSRSGDAVETIKHCSSLATVFSRMGNTEGNRKETVPKVLKEAVNEFSKQLKKDHQGALADRLTQDVLGKPNGGMRLLLKNIAKELQQHPDNAALQSASDRLITELFKFTLDAREQHSGDINGRIGNEVMLSTRDMVGQA